MDKELTKNLIIKIDAASTDPDSIEQMQQINNDGFGLAFDIQAQIVLSKLPLNTELLMIDSKFAHLLEDEIQTLNNNYICVAKDVNKYSQLEELKLLHINFYSGEFLETTEKVNSDQISPSKTAILSLMASLSDPDVELDEVTKLVSADSMLSFKILKIINSPLYRAANELKSIQDAIVRFGFHNLKK